MAQDSIQNVIPVINNCDCSKLAEQLSALCSNSTNCNDVDNTKIICNTILILVGSIIVSLFIATFIDKRWLEKERIMKEQLQSKAREINKLEQENSDLKKSLSRYEKDLEKRVSDLEEKINTADNRNSIFEQ